MRSDRVARQLAAVLLAAIVSMPWAMAQTAPSGPPIKIGFSMALTGSLAVNGKSGLLAMQIWKEDVNAKGGLLGRPVELVYYDDQTNPSLVPGIYTKLLDVDKVDLVVSAYGTNVTAPALPVVIQHNKTFMGLVSRAWPVQTAMRNCTRDEGGPFEVGNQVLTSSHRKLLSSKAMVVNVAETSGRDPGRHD